MHTTKSLLCEFDNTRGSVTIDDDVLRCWRQVDMTDHPTEAQHDLHDRPTSTAAAARPLRWPGLLLSLLAASCGGGSPDRSTTVEAEAVEPANTDRSEEPVASAPAATPATADLIWTEVPAEGGPRPPFEVVPQEIHRLSTYEAPRFLITIGPRRRLGLVGDVRGRWTVYDLESGWARVSRRWIRGFDANGGLGSQGFDPSGQTIFEMFRGDLCVFDLARDAGSCLSTRLDAGESPIAALAPGGRLLTWVAFAASDGEDATRAELRAWEPGAQETQSILSLPGFLQPGEQSYDAGGSCACGTSATIVEA